MSRWEVTYKSIVYNTVTVEAETEEEAEEKAQEMIGELDLCDGAVDEQEVESIIPHEGRVLPLRKGRKKMKKM